MKLISVQSKHLVTMMSWFSNQQEIDDWAGPNFSYSKDIKSFTNDLQMDRIASHALVNNSGELLGFGQYYERLGRCHLGRLVINPNNRGQGIARELLMQLSLDGQQALNVNDISLFVLLHNEAAVNAYKKFGFVETNYPEAISLENCIYMVKANNSGIGLG